MRDFGGRDERSGDLVLLAVCFSVALLGYLLPRQWTADLVGAVRRTALRPVVMLQSRAAQDRTARFQLEELRTDRDSLALLVLADTAVRRENEELRSMLAIRARQPIGWIPAEVLHRPVPTDQRLLTLDAGSDQGVSQFNPVLTPEGLLGFVWSVGPRSSAVLTWMHPDWRASAVALEGAINGILTPSGDITRGNAILELRGVAPRDSVPDGTVVYTSGLGGVYPAMIPVGTVVGVRDDPLGYERLYQIVPFASPAMVQQVMIMTSPAAGAPLQQDSIR
ncbi:MAG TPA: rod shape-determining protein MreC [Gemmatimonadales bacterium]|nr:rod shape-determining protein MreC [Gemmatimonadales bacterium]